MSETFPAKGKSGQRPEACFAESGISGTDLFHPHVGFSRVGTRELGVLGVWLRRGCALDTAGPRFLVLGTVCPETVCSGDIPVGTVRPGTVGPETVCSVALVLQTRHTQFCFFVCNHGRSSG